MSFISPDVDFINMLISVLRMVKVTHDRLSAIKIKNYFTSPTDKKYVNRISLNISLKLFALIYCRDSYKLRLRIDRLTHEFAHEKMT